MKVHAILLVPTEGDPHGLLREGPCGARPPKAWRCDERYHRLKTDHGKWFSMSEAHLPALESGGDALVLAWEGKPVPEGIQRSVHAAKSRAWIEYLVECALGRLTDDLDGLSDPDLPGTLVLLDAEGREVSDD